MSGWQITNDIDRRAYYTAALVCLRFVEARKPTGRRFGPDADARWAGLRGEFGTADRIDVLLRDADAQWPGAFAPRSVFGLRAVAEDDPFGPEWEPLDPVAAEELWRDGVSHPAPETLTALLDAMASVWSITVERVSPPKVGPTDRLLLVGPGAVASTIETFASDPGLDWSDQVVCVASPPAHRHLACLAPAALNLGKPAVTVAARNADADLQANRKIVVSTDAHPADAAWTGATRCP